MLAEWFGLEIIPGERICSRTGAAADLPVLADPALPLEEVAVAELAEEGGVAVDLDDVVPPHIPGRHGEEPRRKDIAGVADEEEAVAVVDPLGPADTIGQ